MVELLAHERVNLACGSTDMRHGFDGLAVMVNEVLLQDPLSGALLAFEGKRSDPIWKLNAPRAWRRKAHFSAAIC